MPGQASTKLCASEIALLAAMVVVGALLFGKAEVHVIRDE